MGDKHYIQAKCLEAIKRTAGVQEWQLRGSDRHQIVVFCRFVVAHELYERSTLNIYDIADWMNKTPKSIDYYMRSYNREYSHNSRFRKLANTIKQTLDEKV